MIARVKSINEPRRLKPIAFHAVKNGEGETSRCQVTLGGDLVESARQEVLDYPWLPGIKNAFSELF